MHDEPSSLAALNIKLKGDLAILVVAEAETKSPSKGPDAVPERDKAADDVREDLVGICHGLRQVVRANPVADGDAIVAKACFKPKPAPKRKAPSPGFGYGGNPGTVRGRIPSPAPGKAYTAFWGASSDGGKTWSDDANHSVTYMFEGLTIEGTYLFRSRVKVGKMSTAWTVSQPVLIK